MLKESNLSKLTLNIAFIPLLSVSEDDSSVELLCFHKHNSHIGEFPPSEYLFERIEVHSTKKNYCKLRKES